MKGVFWAILAVLLVSSVSALEISINDQPLSGTHTFTAGETFSMHFDGQPHATILDVGVTADHAVIEQVLQQELSGLEYSTFTVKDQDFFVPHEFPTASGAVTLHLTYRTSEAERVTETFNFVVTIEASDEQPFLMKLGKFLPQDAQLVLYNHFSGYEVPRIDPLIKPEDLDAEDLAALGIPIEDFTRGTLPTITQTSTREYSAGPVQNFEAEGKVAPEITITNYVYDISYNGNTITKSKVIISVQADGFLPEGEVIIDIPKDIAVSAGLLDTSDFPEVLKDDPVLKWSLKNVPQNQIKDYSYTSDGDVQNFETLAEAAAEKPGFIARILLLFFGE